MNPPNLQGVEEEGVVEGPKSYVNLYVLNKYIGSILNACKVFSRIYCECWVDVLVYRASNNFLCGRRFSRLAKVFGRKDCCCPYY